MCLMRGQRFRCVILLCQLLLTTLAAAFDATDAVIAGVEAYNHGDIRAAFRLLSAEAAQAYTDAEVNLGYMCARPRCRR
jgi:hypothetical protein